MDTKDLELLEFPRICEIIAGYCSFSLSQSMALALFPSSNLNDIQARLEESAEARELIEKENTISISGVEDVRDYVIAASRGKILDPKTLNTVHTSLQVMRILHSKISQYPETMPVLFKIAANITEFLPIERAIERAISPDGEILPNASAKLVSIRHNQITKKAALVSTLQGLITTGTQQHYIQEPIITEREGRFVIPIKSEYRREVIGIVHDVSNSGATLFIEPLQTMELGNALKEEQIEERREIERILTEISELIGGVSGDIIASIDATAVIDLALAKAHYARRFKAKEATVYQPDSSSPPVIHLDDARHPLLGDSAVPLSLELGKDFNVLIITGPNTGGKTVALKTIGLLCLMTQAGLPIPAASTSRLPILEGVFADIGDEQSIQHTLSTFSWHMSNISRILKKAQGYNLILLDELGASTDPQEGAALGRAILMHILASHYLAAITTHYTDLKVFAHITPGLQNASFDFDPETYSPTYKLTLGTPGGSNAIATAAHFGIPDDIISLAKSSLQDGTRQLETLLTNIQQEKQRLETLNSELADEKLLLNRQNNELATELKKFRDEKQRLMQNARDAVIEEVSILQKELKQVTASLRREKSQDAVKTARQTSQIVREQMRDGVLREEDEPLTDDNSIITIGDTVMIKEVGVKAKVVSINERTNQIEVATGSLRFKTDRNSIIKISANDKPDRAYEVQVQIPSKTMSLELDLRGKRADEVEILLDSYLNNAAVNDLRRVRIIHGFGTGTVRSIVRDFVTHHPLVKNFENTPQNEGGDGATIINLK